LVCFLYFQFSVCTIPNVTRLYTKLLFNFYVHTSDPSKIKRIFVYHIKYNINNRGVKKTNKIFCGLFYVTSLEWCYQIQIKKSSKFTWPFFSCLKLGPPPARVRSCKLFQADGERISLYQLIIVQRVYNYFVTSVLYISVLRFLNRNIFSAHF